MDKKNTAIISILIRPKYFPNSNNDKIEEAEKEKVAEVLHQWAEELFSHINKEQIINVECDNANKKNVEGILEKHPKIPVLFYGHGTVYTLEGYYYDETILDTYNNNLLKDRKILAVACHSLSSFAKDCVNKGALCYIGYNNKPCIPWVDNEIIQKSFREPNNHGALKLLENYHSPEDICNDMAIKYEEEIDKLLTLGNEYRIFTLYLINNRNLLGYEPKK